jgi:hypothetical protein
LTQNDGVAEILVQDRFGSANPEDRSENRIESIGEIQKIEIRTSPQYIAAVWKQIVALNINKRALERKEPNA